MLDLDTRAAILKLSQGGHGARSIAKLVGVSRNSVRAVLLDGRSTVPPLERGELLDGHLEKVRELHVACGGNLQRVLEELVRGGTQVGYSTLTAFCRRHEIGVVPAVRAGSYHFEPGEEMQHDTSPHVVEVGGVRRTLQCASLVLCFSRRRYVQCYPRFSRFEARVFLTEALVAFGGAAARCVLDNSTVLMASGTGKDAVPAPDVAALAERHGFTFMAYAVGNKDRAGRVERGHAYVEGNFYPGRRFADLTDLNSQLLQWCEDDARRFRKRLGAAPIELFAIEQPRLLPPPAYVPEVCDLHLRRADVEGYVNLHTNRYSADARLIGRRLDVRETAREVRIFDGHRLAATHEKLPYGGQRKVLLPEHRGQLRGHRAAPVPSPKEQVLRAQGTGLSALIDALQRLHGGRAVRAIDRLHRLWSEYPTDAVERAIGIALAHGLLDLQRLERIVLREVAGDFFRLPVEPEEKDDG